MRTAGEPPDESIDALNEDLSRILLGEGPGLRFRRGGPAGGAGDIRPAARLLLEELAAIARKLERTTEEGRGEVRRIEEIAAALLDLLDPPALERAAG
jgi:molybdenum-dependent DNA-binding transcriptional regulator ModE